jgi:HEAT repeat protein
MGKKGKLIVVASAGGAALVLVLLAAPIYELALEAWLRGKLDSKDSPEWGEAARRLGDLGSIRAIPVLLEASGRPLPSNRSELDFAPAHAALSTIVSKRGLEAMRPLAIALDGSSSQARLTAARLLAKAGPETAQVLPEILSALRKHSGPEPAIQEPLLEAIARAGAPAVPALVELVKGPKESLAYQAACCLGDMGTVALTAIADLLDDPSTSVRWLAVHALIGLGPAGRSAAPRVTELLADPDIALREHARSALAGMKADLKARRR